MNDTEVKKGGKAEKERHNADKNKRKGSRKNRIVFIYKFK